MPKGIYKRTNGFWDKVEKTITCWLWVGKKRKDGYGTLQRNNKYYRAHRISWELTNGRIPAGAWVLHKCDNPPCVNPEHLFLGTPGDNTQDMIKKGRAHFSNPQYGEKHGMSKLKLTDVLQIKKLYKKGCFRQKDLAKAFDVHLSTVDRIINKRSWIYA